jgi:hypothetical protein
VFVYALTEPIDLFDGLIPLPQWISDGEGDRAAWALRAVLALADTADVIRWDGDMRHLPSVGALPVPPEVVPYLVVKQDNNGTTFVVSDDPIGWLLEYCDHHAEATARKIGPWEHTTRSDIPAEVFTGEPPSPLTRPGRPPF